MVDKSDPTDGSRADPRGGAGRGDPDDPNGNAGGGDASSGPAADGGSDSAEPSGEAASADHGDSAADHRDSAADHGDSAADHRDSAADHRDSAADHGDSGAAASEGAGPAADRDRDADDEGASAAPSDPAGPAVDEELLSLRGPPPRVGVLLSLSIVVLCAYLMAQIYPDLRFALEGDEPERAPDPAGVADLGSERYVEIDALELDRALAARVSHDPEPGLAGGKRVVRVFADEPPLWVAMTGNPLGPEGTRDESHRGRLRALSDVPFADALAERARAQGAPRFATAAALAEALADDADRVASPAGEAIPTAAETPVEIVVARPDEIEVTVTRTDEHRSAEAWAEALVAAGAMERLRPPVAAGDDVWVFEADGGLERARARLTEADLWGASAAPAERVVRAPFGELALAGDGDIRIDGEIAAQADIDGVWIEVPREPAPGAMLLIAGEEPGDYRLAVWAFGALGAFALIFAVALVAGARRELAGRPRPPRATAPPDGPPIGGAGGEGLPGRETDRAI